MRRTIAFPIAIVALMVVPPTLAGEEEEMPTLALGYALEIKPGHEDEFEAAMKKQIDWYKANNETWRWNTWQWETGEDFGQYLFRSPGHHWKDMDERSERTAKARAHFQETIGPHLESISAGISRGLPKLSRWPEDLGTVPLVAAYEVKVHYGMVEQFIHTLGKIHEAIVESDWPLQYAWLVTVSGGEIPTFWLVIPHESWADMEGPDKPLWVMMEEAIGRADADALKVGLIGCVREQHASLARFRPDLSYNPE